MNNDAQLAQVALQLLDRVQLQGNEVNAFVQVQVWLRQMQQPQAVEAPEPEAKSK